MRSGDTSVPETDVCVCRKQMCVAASWPHTSSGVRHLHRPLPSRHVRHGGVDHRRVRCGDDGVTARSTPPAPRTHARPDQYRCGSAQRPLPVLRRGGGATSRGIDSALGCHPGQRPRVHDEDPSTLSAAAPHTSASSSGDLRAPRSQDQRARRTAELTGAAVVAMIHGDGRDDEGRSELPLASRLELSLVTPSSQDRWPALLPSGS